MNVLSATDPGIRPSRTNADWIESLSVPGGLQHEVMEELRALLLRAALYTLVTNLADLQALEERERVAVAEDCAQEALLAVLARLSDFRGESKFTTWAYKFAVNIALNRARRERWKGVSLDALSADDAALDWLQWKQGFHSADSETSTLKVEVSHIIGKAIRNELTDRQRQVLKWIVFDEVPMDVVVERLETNRNAVYKLLHDARLKVKKCLSSQGYDVEDVYDLFRPQSR
jgi:RNA polymerase sigma-70 factor (ECF subfamily)